MARTDRNFRLNVLVPVDRAAAISGPHRNVVSTLNGLSARSDVRLTVLCGECDSRERFAQCDDARVLSDQFFPKKFGGLLQNLSRLHKATAAADIVYVPNGLTTFLLAATAVRTRRFWGELRPVLIGGPNVTGLGAMLPHGRSDASPLLTTYAADRWIEASRLRVEKSVRRGTPREQVALVRHGLDLERFHPDRRDRDILRAYGLDPDLPIVLHVGRFDSKLKGIDLLFDVFSRVRDDISNAQLALVGPRGSRLPSERHRPAGSHYLGPIYGDSLPGLYASADVFLGMSRYETFWYPPLEAIASGTPAVVPERGAVPQMIPNQSEGGFTVDLARNVAPGTPASLLVAKRVVQLLQDDELRRRTAEKGRRHIETRFSESRVADDLVEVFRTTLVRRAG